MKHSTGMNLEKRITALENKYQPQDFIEIEYSDKQRVTMAQHDAIMAAIRDNALDDDGNPDNKPRIVKVRYSREGAASLVKAILNIHETVPVEPK
ncbi:MAG TPA: hypothetical protein PLZ84_07445 [Clostridia bacterium]|mgnify:CR=1 FL=1|nr:hypothetical protein [Clostridia bacterium]